MVMRSEGCWRQEGGGPLDTDRRIPPPLSRHPNGHTTSRPAIPQSDRLFAKNVLINSDKYFCFARMIPRLVDFVDD